MDTWLNRDQRQYRLEETDRGNSLEVFSAQKLPATATDTASATGTRNGTEKGGERERERGKQDSSWLGGLSCSGGCCCGSHCAWLSSLSDAVCRCLALSAAGLDSVDADADEMTPLLLRLLRGGCTVVPQHDRNLLDYTLIGH